MDYGDGYLAEVNDYLAQWAYVDGTHMHLSSFGESKNGVWIPKDLSGIMGNARTFI